MQRGFAHLVLLLFILLIAISSLTYFYIVNTPDKASLVSASSGEDLTKPQGVYQNTNLGFEFNYPGGLVAKEDSEEAFDKRGNGNYRKNFSGYVQYEPGKFLGAVSVLDSSNNFDNAPFTLWVFDNPDNLTIEQWYSKYWYYPFVWGDFSVDTKSKVAPKVESSISGQLAKSATISYQPNKPKFVIVNNSGKMYLFRLFTDSSETASSDQILASFKFTN